MMYLIHWMTLNNSDTEKGICSKNVPLHMECMRHLRAPESQNSNKH